MKQLDSLLSTIGTKSSWSTKELVNLINPIKQAINDQLKNDDKVIINEIPKKKVVDVIKRYDVIYADTMGCPHYILVDKVINGIVYGVIITSKDKSFHNLYKVVEDRYFKGNFISNSYVSVLEDDAKEKFVRVIESIKEANLIFRLVRKHYKNILSR
jgi:hexokinase